MLNFNEFHNYTSLCKQLELLEEASQGNATRFSIGKSLQGREIVGLRIADPKHFIPLEYRPAILATGNMHSVELAGSCQVLHLSERLINIFTGREEDTYGVKEQVWYLIPRITPDGTEKALENGARNRSRWIDISKDQYLVLKDINGDGKILEMRWKSEYGRFRLSEKDSRIMLPRKPGDKGPFYEVVREGEIKDVKVGRIKELPLYCDFNRNFPSTEWRIKPDWIGQGRYPLSEPETRALADFVLQHRHINRVLDFHTGNFAVFRATALRPDGVAPNSDKVIFNKIGDLGEKITGWPYVTSYEEIKGKGANADSTFGTFKDWLYESCGIPAYVVEMGMLYNYYGVGGREDFLLPQDEFIEKHSHALLQAHDQDRQKEIFYEWTPFEHEQLGSVEIGGWDVIQWSNPPLPEGMSEACEKGTLYCLELAKYRAELLIDSKIEKLSNTFFFIRVKLTNWGNVNTAGSKQAELVYPHDLLELELVLNEGVSLVEGGVKRAISHLEPAGGESEVCQWVVKVEEKSLEKNFIKLGEVCVKSTRGNFTKQTLSYS